ncbi:hypothetical protein V8C40DRAFT_259945, partial [Trichoderma camerunense]
INSNYKYKEINDFKEEAYKATNLNSKLLLIYNNLNSNPFLYLNSSIINNKASITSDFIYNRPKFKLKENKDLKIYIFQNNLFTRDLLPIKLGKDREMEIRCTSCKFKAIYQLKGFKSSNLARHYQSKHPLIAYNKESEKIRKRSKLLFYFFN